MIDAATATRRGDPSMPARATGATAITDLEEIPDSPDVPDIGGWALPARARLVEQVAQVLLAGTTARTSNIARQLSALTRQAAAATGAQYGQLSMISTRQISLCVSVGTTDPDRPAIVESGLVTELADAVCTVPVRTGRLLRIANTLADPRTCSLPAVTAGALGSYLGSPVHGPDGPIGVLCALGQGRHDWSPEHVDLVARLADRASALLAPLVADLDPAPAALAQ